MSKQDSRQVEPARPARAVAPGRSVGRRPESVNRAAVQRASADPSAATPDEILSLQRAVGNRAVSRLAATGGADSGQPRKTSIQAKLTVGPAGDAYEQEADRVAGEVMRMPAPAGDPPAIESDEADAAGGRAQRKPLHSTITPVVRRASDDEEIDEEEKAGLAQRQATAAEAGFEAGPDVESRLAANTGGGQPLAGDARQFMESRFGADFGGVRIHTGGEAAQLNRQLSAQAFTHGQDIYMGQGKYSPGTGAGKQLLAHELTHVVQQTGGAGKVQANRVQRKEGFMKLDEGVEGEVGLPGKIKKGGSLFPASKLTDPTAAALQTFAADTNAIIHELDNKNWFYVQVPWQQQVEAGAKIDKKKAAKFETEQIKKAKEEDKSEDKESKKDEDYKKGALRGLVPAKKVSRGGHRHKSVSTPIFNGEPSEKDVIQGGLGDCYLLAALAAMARADPARVKKLITENDGETVTVRFYQATKPDPKTSSDFAPALITIRKTVAVKQSFFGLFKQVKFAEGRALWPALVEKAYAAWGGHDPNALPSGYKGAYEGIAGGFMSKAWEALTGHPGVQEKIKKDPSAPNFTTDPEVLKSQQEAMARGEMLASPWDDKLTAGLKIHQVAPGDTLNSIGLTYELDPEVIRNTNVGTFQYAFDRASEDQKENTKARLEKFKAIGVDTDLAAELGGGRIQLRIPASGLDTLGKMMPKMPKEDAQKWIDYLKGGGKAEIDKLQKEQQAISQDKEASGRFTNVTSLDFLAIIGGKAGLSEAGIKALEEYFAGYFEAPKGSTAEKYSRAARELFIKIRQALKEGKYVGVGTPDWGSGGGNAGEDMESLPGLVGGHAYQVVSTMPSHRAPMDLQQDQHWYVFLRNPWGRYGRYESGEGGPQQHESPIVKIEITDLRRYFDHVDFMQGRPPLPPKLSPEKRRELMERLNRRKQFKKPLPPLPGQK